MNPESQSFRQTITVVVFFVLIIGSIYILYQRSNAPQGGENATSAVATTTTFNVPNTKTSVTLTTKGSGYTIEQVPITHTQAPQTPEYKAPLVCAPSISTDTCAMLTKQAVTATTAITKNKSDLDTWINLGVVRKQAGDYKGAEAAWQYVSAVSPTNIISFNNLGDLYMSYLKDYPKAVASYMQEIKNLPTNLDSYKNIFQIYTTTSYTGGAGAAEAILKQGIVANPKAVDLQVILARYYKSSGRTADAKATYQAAITSAQSQGQTSLATDIRREFLDGTPS